MLVPMTSSMLDLASTQQFIEMTTAYFGVIEDTVVRMDHDFISFLIAQNDLSNIPSQKFVSLMGALFQE
jgi:chromosome partitioning protein